MNQEQKVRQDITATKESLDQHHDRAFRGFLGSLALTGAAGVMAYISHKSGTPVEVGFWSATAATGLATAGVTTHTAMETGQRSAALEGTLAQHDLTTAARQDAQALEEASRA
ncbi:MAG TPA: hypothetical protein VD706_02190 [Candidatus Saccharimonadales bacterium]|nr:hypothetical protein [Candidatus Saccharimonadales bacterium]